MLAPLDLVLKTTMPCSHLHDMHMWGCPSYILEATLQNGQKVPKQKPHSHHAVTGKSVTAVLHFINTTPIDWYSKRQTTKETPTYGSEFVDARTATEQIFYLRNTLWYLGIPIMTKAYMLVTTNQSSPVQPDLTLCSTKGTTCCHTTE